MVRSVFLKKRVTVVSGRTNLLLISALLASALVVETAAQTTESTPAATSTEATTSTEGEQQPLSREERLRQHEERVRKIIEERRKARAAEQSGETPAATEAAPEPGTPPPSRTASVTSDFGNLILYNAFRVEKGTGLQYQAGNQQKQRTQQVVAASEERPQEKEQDPAAAGTQNQNAAPAAGSGNERRRSSGNEQQANNVIVPRDNANPPATNETTFNQRAASPEVIANEVPTEVSGVISKGFAPEAGVDSMLQQQVDAAAEYEYALDAVMRKGERFVSEVRIQNSQKKEFDRVRIALRYDKRFMKPLRVFDQEIRSSLKVDPRVEIVERDNLLIYDGDFAAPRSDRELVVLRIVWEAKLTTEFTQVNFHFAGGETEETFHTGVYSAGKNILGEADDPFDGVLGGSLLIIPPFDPNREDKATISQGKKEELRKIYLANVGGQNPVGLQLVAPELPPQVGETFPVDVVLNNPGGSVVDSVRFFVLFDPKVLQVVDKDAGNWIRRGVNVHDGPYRINFPFEFHKYNSVDNERGRIRYAKSIGKTLTLPTGTFATIHFRAIAPTTKTTVAFAQSTDGGDSLTDVRILGYSVFSTNAEMTTPELELTILPQAVAAGETPSEEAVALQSSADPQTPAFLVNPVYLEQLRTTP
ncbi:MAG: cohesin domain-containing protein [Candidatus Sumerlaeia bacterium]|nr:cohesin domain-containing protein [Candidatus Sumerlaeia bacterium]